MKCCLQVQVGLFPQGFPYCWPYPCLSRFGILWDPIHTEEHTPFHVFSKLFLTAVTLSSALGCHLPREVLRVDKALPQHCGEDCNDQDAWLRRAEYVFRRQLLWVLMGHQTYWLASKLMLERWRQEDHKLENTFHCAEGSSSLPERVRMLLTLQKLLFTWIILFCSIWPKK